MFAIRNSLYNLAKNATKINHNLIQSSSFSVITKVQSSNLKFTQKHEWISLNGDIGTVGISDYAQVIL